MSLTGKRHGPFKDPWRTWWEESGPGFAMPDTPQPANQEREDGPGVTFYGIHTFSDRILFILDVSGSMDQ